MQEIKCFSWTTLYLLDSWIARYLRLHSVFLDDLLCYIHVVVIYVMLIFNFCSKNALRLNCI